MELALVLCMMLGFGVAMIGAIAGIFVLATKASKQRRTRFAAAGQALGLAPAGSGGLSGVREGVRVSIRHVTEGSGDNRSNWTYVQAELDPPLRLGLNLRARGWGGTFFAELLGTADQKLGDAAFDDSFTLRAVEEADVPRFFSPELRVELMRAKAASSRFWMTDETVHISLRGFQSKHEALGPSIEWVVRVARAARVARVQMGPTAREQEVLRSWGALAANSGFHLDPESLVLSGTEGRGLPFQIVPTLAQSGWSTRFRVAFDRPLGVDLHLKRSGAFAPVARFFGMQDISIGDVRFDDAFVIKGTDVPGVRHVLDEEKLRGDLLALLGNAKSFEVHDDHVDATAMGLVIDAAALHQSLHRVVLVAEGLRARVAAPRVGAYR